ncbi:hypothetical protein G3I59_07990 [Amycolatopsis rubida]|uniref:PE family protein n=1 Tax=Amycolatopsis rubida TaxID=112413 RepID=A0ABX0BN54_9PSEU|nr:MULTISPECIES: hypothetical protein [Amycolatopsis]MYW90561.1 hypothetical protein [Amycolatopsis rubida]NEC55542.1 hypothetical protein [Amycolatopsis rubida]OAP22270.1 hypothetical protein A4R44_07080 [Amycolatopsis sp. M39]
MVESDPGQVTETTGWLTGLPITVVGAAMNVAKGVSDAAAVASATKAGAGLTLNRDEAQSLLERAKRLQHSTRAMIPDAEALTRLTPPAADPGSTGFNQQAVKTFENGKESLEATHQYMAELIGRLEKALGIVGESDSQAAADVKTAGNSDEGKGILG